MAKLCNDVRVFFRARPGGTGRNFTQSHRYSPLAEFTLLRGSCLVPAEIRHRRGRETSVNRPWFVGQPFDAVRLQPFTATGHAAKMIYYRSARLQWITSSIENSP
jgi:hypothetical protein